MPIEIVRQSQNNTCLMCVLAMLVGETEQYVLDWFVNIDPPINDEDAYVFLAHHGIFLANYADLKPLGGNGKGVEISERQEFVVPYTLENRMAYLVVDSPNYEGRAHAVLWDGHQVYDPLKDAPQELCGYGVRKIYPMLFTEKRLEYFRKRYAEKGVQN